MTLAQAAAIAARLGASFAGETIPAAKDGAAWYGPSFDYLSGVLEATGDGVLYATLAAEPGRQATRAEFFALLTAVTPAEQLPAINAITSLPDTEAAGVLALYNAGILTGVDAYGTFAGEKTSSAARWPSPWPGSWSPGSGNSSSPWRCPPSPTPASTAAM